MKKLNKSGPCHSMTKTQTLAREYDGIREGTEKKNKGLIMVELTSNGTQADWLYEDC